MIDFVENLKQLYDNELWSNLCQMGALALTLSNNQQSLDLSILATPPSTSTSSASTMSPTPIMTQKQRLQVLLMVADAHFAIRGYRKAESLYKEALQTKKLLSKTKSSTKDGNDESKLNISDVDIKYKMYECYVFTSQSKHALNILQAIPAKQRTPKANMALGKLYLKGGMERPALTCFREVLKTCPFSLEAAELLLQLGAKPKEIQELTLEGTSGLNNMDWFNPWILANSFFATRDYATAVSSLRKLEESSWLRNEVGLLVNIGLAENGLGNIQRAGEALSRAHRIDPLHLKGMDVYASILCKEKKHKELETLATKMMGVTEDEAEPWVALAFHCYLNKKGSKAVYFAHKACLLNQRCVEALLLKGQVLLDMKKIPDALNHFKEAALITNNRFEIHKGQVECYLAQSRQREAVGVAAAACKLLGNTPRALSLFASVLMKDPYQMSLPRAKTLLEKALQADPSHLPAVYMLTEILEQEQNLDEAIELLRKQIKNNSTCKLHQMLADLLAKTHEEEKAMEHYTIALNLDPKNATAQEGLQKIERNSDGPLETTYDLEMEDMNSEEGDLEESETEAVWSDGDLNLGASNTRYL